MQSYGIIAFPGLIEIYNSRILQKQDKTLTLYQEEWLILLIIFQYLNYGFSNKSNKGISF